jgi:hypothetical protein
MAAPTERGEQKQQRGSGLFYQYNIMKLNGQKFSPRKIKKRAKETSTQIKRHHHHHHPRFVTTFSSWVRNRRKSDTSSLTRAEYAGMSDKAHQQKHHPCQQRVAEIIVTLPAQTRSELHRGRGEPCTRSCRSDDWMWSGR